MEQRIIRTSGNYKELDDYLSSNEIHSFLLICDNSLKYLKIKHFFEELEKRTGIRVVQFSDFQSNPQYESVVKGVELFRSSGCENIVVIGGGSAIDVAKCIKLYSNMEGSGAEGSFLKQPIIGNNVKLLAIPTTAGTGAEATRYAVIYFNGEKQSITHDSIIPETVLFDSSVLKTLPVYQKKVTMLDAFCHSIESFWSVNSTAESKNYSRRAIEMILSSINGYMTDNDKLNAVMLEAAHIAGKAINITQTTAGHAMCYKLTSLYGIAHGHAAALCVRKIWPWMLEHTDKCIDPRGEMYLKGVFNEIADAMGCRNAVNAAKLFEKMILDLELFTPEATEEDYGVLKSSVNLVRLKNHPIELDPNTIDSLYREILRK